MEYPIAFETFDYLFNEIMYIYQVPTVCFQVTVASGLEKRKSSCS